MTMTLEPPRPVVATTPQRLKLIVILGVSRSGKDTLGRHLATTLRDSCVIKFASPIKTAIAGYLGVAPWMLEDDEFRNTVIPELDATPLELLVRSFEHMPNIHPQLGIYKTRREVEEMMGCGVNTFIFTDCRNLSEAEYILNLLQQYNASLVLVRVKRDAATPKHSDRLIPSIYDTLSCHAVNNGITLYNNGSMLDYLEAGTIKVLELFNKD